MNRCALNNFSDCTIYCKYAADPINVITQSILHEESHFIKPSYIHDPLLNKSLNVCWSVLMMIVYDYQ